MAATETSEFLSKRRRFGGASSQPILVGASTPTKYGSPQLQTTPLRGTTTISNITLRKWTPGGDRDSVAGEVREGQQPKYCPGDREQLLRRLATFQELTEWMPKPDPVNEVEWAKRGWVCHGKERVKCTLCSKEIFVRVNKKEVDGKEIAVMIASEIEQSVVDMYKDMIITAHAEDCLWRRRGCDDSLLRLPLPNPKLALETLRQRYDELLDRKDSLPDESSLRLPESLDIAVVLSYLPANFFTDPPPRTNNPTTTTSTTPSRDNVNGHSSPSTATTKPNTVALTLAVMGWQGHSDSRVGHAAAVASCHTCLRRLGLWMFKPKEIETDKETHKKSLVPAVMDHLDPLREHRFFCPWKNGAAQRNSGAKPNPEGDKPAWEILIQGLRNEAFIRQRTTIVHSRSKSTIPSSSSQVGGGGDGSGVAAGRRDVLANAMKTPERRPMTSDGRRADQVTPLHQQHPLLRSPNMGEGEEEEDDEETKKKKDLDMMSRLRRVKSLFNAKAAGSKLKRLGSSRPGTSHSTMSKASKTGE